MTKLGFEIVGVGKDAEQSHSTWNIAARAARGEVGAGRLWREFERATKGARMIEMDERVALLARRGKLERVVEDFWLDDDAQSVVVEVEVSRDDLALLRAAERRDPRFFGQLISGVQLAKEPLDEWSAWLDVAAVVASRSAAAARARFAQRRADARGGGDASRLERSISSPWPHALALVRAPDSASPRGHRGASGQAREASPP